LYRQILKLITFLYKKVTVATKLFFSFAPYLTTDTNYLKIFSYPRENHAFTLCGEGILLFAHNVPLVLAELPVISCCFPCIPVCNTTF
jgi:hypothetical protein